MTFGHYYEDELAYLRELGDAFSKANPAIAGLISQRARDPDVERLLEGFAFLTGRLRQRLDEELPELSHGMLALLWPHYLRPIPALSIVAFSPPASGVLTTVPAGAALAARPIEGISCRFRTCFDLTVLPFRVSEAHLEEGAASAALTLDFEAVPGADVGLLTEERLRLFLDGGRSARLGTQLLALLLRGASALEVSAGSAHAKLAASELRHAALAAGEAMLPWPRNAFPGYRLLQEYLVFPERFLFVDLPLLPQGAGFSGPHVRVTFHIGAQTSLPTGLSAENFRLNAVPVINLYEAAATPFAPDRRHVEYRLEPMQPASRFARIYSVDEVRGLVQGRAAPILYEPFESFRHVFPGHATRFYRVHRRASVLGDQTEISLSFADAEERRADPDADTISARLTCTDGALAEAIPIGGIDRVAVGSPAVLEFRNVTRVAPEVSPPLSGATLWRLIAGLVRSLRPLDDVASLGRLIATYDFRAAADAQARRRLDLMLASLHDLAVRPMLTVIDGIPAHGRRITLSARESGFGGPEGLFLFGAVFDAFLGVYAGLNTSYQTILRGTEGNVELSWPIHGGRVPRL